MGNRIPKWLVEPRKHLGSVSSHQRPLESTVKYPLKDQKLHQVWRCETSEKTDEQVIVHIQNDNSTHEQVVKTNFP